MAEVKRYLDLNHLLAQKSFFLFGARASGKSTLIAQQLRGKALIIDLLEQRSFRKASTDPEGLAGMIAHSKHKTVVIGEIQRLPELLNEVHMFIERHKLRFLLTGSSTRKLRRGGVNLLAGRAWRAHLFPLIRAEIPEFDLDRYLQYGGLPAVYFSEKPEEELDAYVLNYLREEIQAEGFIRGLPPFNRFLLALAISNTSVINFTKLADDCQISPTTVREYVQILEDTMLGSLLSPWKKTKKRKATATAKFYFFDTGVARILAGTDTVDRNSNLYGKAFEQFIWMELRAYLSYTRKKRELTFWRSRGGHEVDFLIGEELAIEVKASRQITRRDWRGLKALAEEGIFRKYYLVSHDTINTKSDNFYAVYWQNFLDDLWDGKLLP